MGIKSLPEDISKEKFDDFINLMVDGFARGEETHGLGSNKTMDLIDEIIQEFRDVACYSFFQYIKLVNLKEKLNRLEGTL